MTASASTLSHLADKSLSESPSGALQGQTVVLFGGTSGMGLAAAVQAKAAGAKVIVIGSDAERARQAATANCLDGWRVADVTRSETITTALADIAQIDHLVLLAGSFVAGKVRDAPVDYLHRAFDERIWASVHTIRTLGDRLSKNGSITFISGALSDRPNAFGTAVLGAASAAMEALTRGLALELAPTRVNALSPGITDTPLLGRAFGDGLDAFVSSLKEKLPLHRLVTAAEAGAAVVFLMTNGGMNGETLHIDGSSRLA